MAGGIQSQVNGVQAPAVAGDYADSNPRFRALGGPGGLVTGTLGVTVGRFAWLNQSSIDPDNAATIVNNFPSPGLPGVAPDGFVSRPDAPAIITTYLADATMLIQPGSPVPLWSSGGYWCKNDGSTQALYNQKAYADLATGKVSFAASGAASTVGITGSIAAATWSASSSQIAGNVLTAGGTITGTIAVGSVLTSGGSGNVVAQLSGTPGGAGSYALSVGEQSVAAGTSVGGSYGTLTVTVGSGIEVGALLGSNGATVAAGTYVTALGTGSGGLGTYIVNATQTVGSGTMTTSTNVETKFYAKSSGLAGELVKISSVL
jgi:hypothetical protein